MMIPADSKIVSHFSRSFAFLFMLSHSALGVYLWKLFIQLVYL